MVNSQDTRNLISFVLEESRFFFFPQFFPSAQIYKRFNFTAHILRDSVNIF